MNLCVTITTAALLALASGCKTDGAADPASHTLDTDSATATVRLREAVTAHLASHQIRLPVLLAHVQKKGGAAVSARIIEVLPAAPGFKIEIGVDMDDWNNFLENIGPHGNEDYLSMADEVEGARYAVSTRTSNASSYAMTAPVLKQLVRELNDYAFEGRHASLSMAALEVTTAGD